MFELVAGVITREVVVLVRWFVTNDQTFALMSANLKGENRNLLSSGFSIYEPIKVFVEHPGFVPRELTSVFAVPIRSLCR